MAHGAFHIRADLTTVAARKSTPARSDQAAKRPEFVQPAVLFLDFRTFGHGVRVTKKFGFGFAPSAKHRLIHTHESGFWQLDRTKSARTDSP